MTNGEWNCSDWSQEDTDDFVAKIMIGPLVGIALGLIVTILASLPLCCGVMKAQGKVIAMVAIPVGIIAALMPLFLSMTGCDSFVENLCSNCENQEGGDPCKDEGHNGKTVEEELHDGCKALGFLVAYLLAYGWAAVLLGALAAGFGCCILCGCCQMKKDDTVQTTTA